MAANMYRVGDYVYFETSSTASYQIRRIEELIKTPNGNVEAKVMCFYRRKDISSSLVLMADKHQSLAENMDDKSMPTNFISSLNFCALDDEQEQEIELLSERDRHQLKHRELFLSRQVETLPATHIRGKCTVTLLNETESLASYLNKENNSSNEYKVIGIRFVSSAFDQQHFISLGEDDGRHLEDLETLVYTPHHNLSDRQIDQFLIICRSIGTFARALDCSSSVKQPSLHMSAAAASRDITLFHAMDILHQHNYDIASAISSLVTPKGPILCRDEMEEWSASEANLFEEALEKYGKDFIDIRQDFLPWKSLKNIVDYYYMWKTTDRHVQQKRVKAVEAESKLKQVYIPNYNNKPTPLNGPNGETLVSGGRPCESCYTLSSHQWYAWGPPLMQCRLCQLCWSFWKRYGGLKYPSKLDGELQTSSRSSDNDSSYSCRDCNKAFNRQERLTAHIATHRPHRCGFSSCGKEFKLKAHLARHCASVHDSAIRVGSPRPIIKTRVAFYLCTTPLTRLARRVCAYLLQPHSAARNPFKTINVVAVKQECQNKLLEGLPKIPKPKPRNRGSILDISHRLGAPNIPTPEWLIALPKDKLPQPERLAFIPPPRGKGGQLLIPWPPYKEECRSVGINSVLPTILRKRGYEQQNGVDGPAAKHRAVVDSSADVYKMADLPRGTIITRLNGRAKMATIRFGGRKQTISLVDAPDDLYFVATPSTRKLRRQVGMNEVRRAARRPSRKLYGKIPQYGIPSHRQIIVQE
ncbi:metastasis-associated protein MTA3-like [Limulus polyphemus]|uniref:Metastasis-associated protein MTA3-like n=1 Tax=Limulus polyphemus TaxID=6850 RepID=A0ABM1T0L6_LIMPO|nr:metastasis-associated protein MTA3-like [Limulus polyphemus]